MAFGIFKKREKSKKIESQPFLTLNSCVQLTDVVELALRFINYDVLCFALLCIPSHCYAIQCSWPSFVYFIILCNWFIFFLAECRSRHVFPSLCVAFRRIWLHCNPMCTGKHIAHSDVYFCIMSITVFFLLYAPFLKVFLHLRRWDSLDLCALYGLSTLRHCWSCCHPK